MQNCAFNPELLQQATQASHACNGTGIGRLSEKRLHSVLKYYFEPDESCHEIKIAGYFADIANADGITEIQTASFRSLKSKLEVFLPSWQVNVVYPAPQKRQLYWLEPETGEISNGQKTTKKGALYEIFKELVFIKPFLTNKNLSFSVVLLDIDEYKLLDGYGKNKKTRATKHERVPTKINDIINIGGTSGYSALLPAGLPAPFSTKDFRTAASVHPKIASAALTVLKSTGTVKEVGKKGNLILYEINE